MTKDGEKFPFSGKKSLKEPQNFYFEKRLKKDSGC